MDVCTKETEYGMLYSLSNFTDGDKTQLDDLYSLATHYRWVEVPGDIRAVNNVKHIDLITDNYSLSYCIIITVYGNDKCLWTIVPRIDDKIICIPVFGMGEVSFQAKQYEENYIYNSKLAPDITYDKLKEILINVIEENECWHESFARTDLTKRCYGGYLGSARRNPSTYFSINEASDINHVILSYATRQEAGFGMDVYLDETITFDLDSLVNDYYNNGITSYHTIGLWINSAENNEIVCSSKTYIPIIEFKSEEEY